MDVKESIIDKVRKVLALTHSNIDGEAKAALLMAQKLMAEHHLVMADVASVDKTIKQVVDDGVFESARMPWFYGKTARIIADNFRCYAYINRGYRSKTIQFIGLKEDVDLAKMVFSSALEMMNYHAKKYMKDNHLTGAGIRNTYIGGYMVGLKEQFDEQVKHNDWGLVLVKDAEVKSVYDKLNLRSVRSKVRMTGDQHAQASGIDQGRQFKVVSGKLTQ